MNLKFAKKNMMQPCKTLFIKTLKIWKMYKGIRKNKRENLYDITLQKFIYKNTEDLENIQRNKKK